MKRAFTLIEILVVLVLTTIVMAVLISAISASFNMYNESLDNSDSIGSQMKFLSDVSSTAYGCANVYVVENQLFIAKNGVDTIYDPQQYGLDATILIDSSKSLILINMGGREFCLNYIIKEN